jgi:hypothetical protein
MKNKKRNGQPLVQVVPDTADTEGGWETGKGTFQRDTFEYPEVPVEPAATATGVPLGSVVPVPVPAPPAKLLDIDKAALDLARERRKTALAEAKTALAQNDNAELSYKYVILQLYMKYGLSDRDAISENGDIVKDGALPKPQGVPVK